MHNCRKSDVEITCVSTSTQTECCEIFDRAWRKVAETRRCFIVHPTYCDARLHVLHRHGCNYGHGLRLASTVYVQTMLATLFIVYCSASAFPHFYSVTGPTLAVGALLLEQAHWFSELWLQPMLAASDLCSVLCWGGGGQDSILGSKPHLQVSSDAGLYATRYVSRLDITYTNLIMYAKF